MIRPGTLALILVLLQVGLVGQEQERQTITATFEAGWTQLDPVNDVFTAVGNVRLTWLGGELRCDNAVIWCGSGEEAPAEGEREGFQVREVYAEGEVHLRQGEHWLHLESARGFVDPVNDRGLFFDTTMSLELPGKDGKIKLTARAAEAIRIAEDRFELRDIRLTTSPFADPGYHISSARLRLQLDPPAQDPQGKPGETVRNLRYELDGSVLALEGVDVLPLPGITGNTQDDSFNWIKRIGVDKSSRFGYSGFLSVGNNIRIDDQRWGDWTLHTRYLGDRGPGLGLDLQYETPDYRGRFEGFYQHDEGRDELFGAPPDNERGRALWRHRHHDIGEGIQLDLEFSKLTDRGYLPEYEEEEFKSGKEQETLAYFRRAMENRAATLLVSTRLNEWQTQVERQPQFRYDLIAEPLVDLGPMTLYYDAGWEVSRSRLRYDDFLDRNDRDAFRADLDNGLSAPFFAGPVKLEPFVGMRYTHYSNGALGSASIDRVGFLYGLRATTELARSFDLQGGLFDLEGLRHIIMPEIEYLRITGVSEDLVDVIQFDRLDRLDEYEVIRLGLRNRLQTIWHIDGEDRVVDFLDLDLEWSFFPKAERDNRGEELGNLDLDLMLRLDPRFTWLVDFEYSFRLDTMEIFNTTLGWAASPEFQLALGYRRYVDVNDVGLIQAQWRPTERLGFRLDLGYDFEDDEFQDTRLTLVRYGVDWVFEVELDWDKSEGFGFGISISPRALFDPRLRARTLRGEPRFLDFDDGLIR
ncbi:MAG: LPS assembly protein LptD [Planctomycetes bacterium]|nr:LPS assembly protein LptD [Planctomycetota bacterium]